MSLEITPTSITITSDSGGFIVDKDTKMIPFVYQGIHTTSITFPNLPKAYFESRAIDGFDYYQVWALTVFARNDEGSVELATMPTGTNPNLIIANIRATRTGNPDEGKFGPFIKSIPENVWIPIRSGLRLEYSAFMRRIVWLEISGSKVNLRWKQSTSNYAPIQHDTSVGFPAYYLTTRRPPGYRLGYFQGSNFIAVPPSVLAERDAINFISTWSFDINLGVMQV